jgi:hypothetical protein
MMLLVTDPCQSPIDTGHTSPSMSSTRSSRNTPASQARMNERSSHRQVSTTATLRS